MQTLARTWFRSAIVTAGMIAAMNCSDGANQQGAPLGTERGACRADGSCDAGLTCLSNVCVNASGGGGSSSSAGGTSSVTPPTGGAPDTDSSSGAGGEAMTPDDSSAGSTSEGGAPGVPENLDCRTEESYLICAHSSVGWAQARAYCQSQGGDLVKIDDDTEDATLTELLTETGSAWIGANDIETEGEFVWPDGSSVSSGETSWATDQPNDNADGGEDCAVLHSGSGEWNDVNCDETEFAGEGISIICEMP